MDLLSRLRGDGQIVTERLAHWAVLDGDRPFFRYGEDGVTLTYADFARRTGAM
jgi:crotonobetaine/carnitine-CoA ligase